MLLPIALDLLLAFGPGITSTTVIDTLLNQAASAVPASGGGEQGAGLSAGIAEYRSEWLQVNLLAALTMHLPSAVTVTAMVPKIQGQVVADIPSWPEWFGAMGVLVAGGLALASVYLTGLAGCVRGNPPGAGGLLKASGQTFGRLLALYGMLVFVGIPVSLVLIWLVSFIGGLAPVMASLLGTLLMAAFMLAAFYAAFLEEALVLNGAWPVPAAILSARVVFRHFWSTLGFIALSFVITIGVPVVWRLLVGHPAGLIAVIVAHAYISSGLAVAAMLFFWQRRSFAVAQSSGAQSLS
ncbi:MAG: hypothetical protein EXR52_04150 [Dehalococcoidia bacterium]|nr:hypothetical protein [Dehalococcoidia bacterium]